MAGTSKLLTMDGERKLIVAQWYSDQEITGSNPARRWAFFFFLYVSKHLSLVYPSTGPLRGSNATDFPQKALKLGLNS